jgi:exonuclease SbcC
MYTNHPQGSEWRKWDLHLHGTETFLANNYKCSTSELASEIKKNELKVVGLTDYFIVKEHEYQELKRKLGKECYLIPNFEFRINDKNKDAEYINIHVLFNLENLNFKDIYDCLSRVRLNNISDDKPKYCTLDNIKKYRADSITVSFDELLNQLKQDFKETTDYIIVSACDGYGGFRPDGKNRNINTALKIDKKSHMIFGSENNRNFFLNKEGGRKSTISSIKPVLNCSDAHTLDNVGSKFTWIKADPTFEGLKQVLYEPEERVSIQESIPFNKNSYNLIKEVRYIDDNFTCEKIKINSNLTSIIGGKSTGKSLLLKNIAKTIDINEYKNRLESAGLKDIKPVKNMEVIWADERIDKLGEKRNNRRIIYIPQSYLNRVVDESEQSTDIDTIIEDVLLQQKKYSEWSENYIIEKNTNEELIDRNIRVLLQLKENKEINNEKRKKIGDLEGIYKEKEHLKYLINQLKNDSTDVDIDQKLKNFESLSKSVAVLRTRDKNYQDDWLKLKGYISEDSIRSLKTLNLNSKELQVDFDQLLSSSRKEFDQIIYNGAIELMEVVADKREKILREIASKNDELNEIKNVVEKQSRLKEYLEKLSILTEKEEKISAISENIQSNIKTGKEIIDKLTEYVSFYYDLLIKSQDEVKKTTKDLEFKIKVDFKKNEFNNILLKYFDGRKIKTEDFKYIKDYDFDTISYFQETLKKFIKDIVN